ncbi:hypothetical protein CB0940_09459 [Cercospora beticola]|uniref:Uncharacterized protein n=1 Tax=Cercospora beticola TaxID=122368 RepID=A0A2G5HIB8_CERBT|nr:hypothetical protein CB0940_09459 [Cercospora beticola]PIA92301.1 hypothetical protein CB0940_09459 [Cercospora beticola]WPB06225.1 hypothetical protein RHO25_010882 [Cercospora beticola]
MRLFRSITGNSGSFGGWTKSKSRGGVRTKQPDVVVRAIQDDGREEHSGSWTPPTFKVWYLATLIVLTWILIAVIAWLLVVSNREQGIIFAANINELPLSKSFTYLYLPTIISVFYGFLWTWLDLDIKRLEPYFQMSKDGGASGDNSINLAYPLQFLLTIPFSALKRSQWNVFVGSLVIIAVIWGLTPIQSGIFAVRTITMHESVPGVYSTAYIPLSQQGNTSSIYAQSVYNIAWLNETLPPFMTKDYVLSPFKAISGSKHEGVNTTFTGLTTAYSVDLSCEEATFWNNSGGYYYNSTGGCSMQAPTFRPFGGNDTNRPFDTLYAGYQNREGFAQYYLEGYCDERFFHLFFVRWSKVTQAYIQTPMNTGSMEPFQAENDTSLFCQASYYQQQVNATISVPSNAVIEANPIGVKLPLPADLFNISSFEWAMNSGQEQVATRGEWPTTSFPDQKSQLLDMPINLDWLPRMAPFAIATNKLSAEEYLDPENLRQSYESAYRLLFSRQVVDLLKVEINETTQTHGAYKYVTQAVIVVPGFAYAALAVLGLVMLLAVWFTLSGPRRANKLRYDPATIGALMDLTAGDSSTAATFASHDRNDEDHLKEALSKRTFVLDDTVASHSDAHVRLHEVNVEPSPMAIERPSSENYGIRPLEMKAYIGAIFLTLQCAAVVNFAVLFAKARKTHGLALPSTSTFVRQLLENYVPIALATLIEPFWLILNRLVGLLQPFEEMRKGSATAQRSIDLDYSSLPPQFLFMRAIKARHFTKAAVCFMVLLANVLSVALSGLMYEGTNLITHTSGMIMPYLPSLVELRGTGPPFNGALRENSDGSGTVEPFYRAMSNVTADTPLPPWAGENIAYWPMDTAALSPSAHLEINTSALAAELVCYPLGAKNYVLDFAEDASSVNFNMPLQYSSSEIVTCSNFKSWTRAFGVSGLNSTSNPEPGRQALEMSAMLSTRSVYASELDVGQDTTDASDARDLFCRQHIVSGWLRADWRAKTSRRNSRGNYDFQADSLNSTFIICRPTILTGNASAIFDAAGRVTKELSADLITPNQTLFSDLIAQTNRFLVDSGATWHNDSFPSDYNNYLIEQARSATTKTLLNPEAPPPEATDAAEQYARVYNRLFPILVSTNHQYLFQHNEAGTSIQATIITPETRILFSTPAFVVVEAIFGLYILTTIIFYARRPWRILPRLPSTIASQIAFFAGSQSLRDMAEWRGDRRQGRKAWRWGFGEYVAVDGSVRLGIEREPLVKRMYSGNDGRYSEEPPPYEEDGVNYR